MLPISTTWLGGACSIHASRCRISSMRRLMFRASQYFPCGPQSRGFTPTLRSCRRSHELERLAGDIIGIRSKPSSPQLEPPKPQEPRPPPKVHAPPRATPARDGGEALSRAADDAGSRRCRPDAARRLVQGLRSPDRARPGAAGRPLWRRYCRPRLAQAASVFGVPLTRPRLRPALKIASPSWLAASHDEGLIATRPHRRLKAAE